MQLSLQIWVSKGFGVLRCAERCSAPGCPVVDTAKPGGRFGWNTAFQGHFAKYFWPEVEFNATYFKGGPNDGKNQTFATPCLSLEFGRIRPQLALLRRGPGSIFTSRLRCYNHEIAITTRGLF